MKKSLPHQLAIGLAAVCLITFTIMLATGHIADGGPAIISFFLALAIGFVLNPKLKGFTYTIIIFAAVATALYYPANFVELKGYKLSGLITPLLQIIMFGMGTSMSVHDFAGVLKNPRGVFIGVTSHLLLCR